MRQKRQLWVCLAISLAATVSVAQQTGQRLSSRGGQQPQMNPGFGNLPLTFEANQGQVNAQAKFVARGRGYTAFLTTGGMVLSLRAANAPEPKPLTATSPTQAPTTNKAVFFNLLGAAPNPTMQGEDLQPGRLNYFIGNNPKGWRTNVPTYARVRYKNVYPGIDLVYYGSRQRLEYDFQVTPGGDANRIQFEIKGASNIQLDPDGNLVLKINDDEVHFQSPIVYQQINGQRVAVNGGYTLKDPTHVSFRLAQYDRSKPLVIDPVLEYCTYLGGSVYDRPQGIAIDGTGAVYLTGETQSPDFPGTSSSLNFIGVSHVFVAKIDPTGSTLLYADIVGGNDQETGYALAVDGSNQVYVTGATDSTNFPTVNAFQNSHEGGWNWDAFLVKISADGSQLLYSTYLGGSDTDYATSIAVDASDEMYVAGWTQSTDFPVFDAYQASVSPNQGGVYGQYGFLAKFSADGSSLVYSTYFGGSSSPVEPVSRINALALDSNADVYVAGLTSTSDFPVTQGAYSTIDSVAQSNTPVGFVSEFDVSGGLRYSTFLYGDETNIFAIAVDGTGSAYVTGANISDGTFPVTSTSICDPTVYGAACGLAFVTKLNPTGSGLVYSTFLGPNNNAAPEAIALDSSNNAYILGEIWNGSFSTVNGIESWSTGASSNLVLVEIDSTASTELFATYFGGSGGEVPAGIAIDTSGNMYIAGMTYSTDLPVTIGAYQGELDSTPQYENNYQGANGFLAKIEPDSEPAFSPSPAFLQFSNQVVGQTPRVQSIHLRNMGSSPMLVSSIKARGDFAQTNNCNGGVPAAGSCTLNVTFTPTAEGVRSGSVVIEDNAVGSPHILNVQGWSSGSLADFSLSSSSSNARVQPGARATYFVTVTPVGGAFSNPIQLACSGAPVSTTCSVSPASITPGATVAAVIVTVNTAGALAKAAPRIPAGRGFGYAIWLQLPGLGAFGMLAMKFKRDRKRLLAGVLLASLLPILCFLTACAGGTGTGPQNISGTATGTYVVTVTGTSGTLQHSLPLTLTIQ